MKHTQKMAVLISWVPAALRATGAGLDDIVRETERLDGQVQMQAMGDISVVITVIGIVAFFVWKTLSKKKATPLTATDASSAVIKPQREPQNAEQGNPSSAIASTIGTVVEPRDQQKVIGIRTRTRIFGAILAAFVGVRFVIDFIEKRYRPLKFEDFLIEHLLPILIITIGYNLFRGKKWAWWSASLLFVLVSLMVLFGAFPELWQREDFGSAIACAFLGLMPIVVLLSDPYWRWNTPREPSDALGYLRTLGAKLIKHKKPLLICSLGLALVVFVVCQARSAADRRLLADIRTNAEKGDAKAQCDLGKAFFEGKLGVRKNYAEAEKWFLKSAEQNYAEAQCNLGLCYFYDQSYAEARKWYRKAAEQNHAEAQYNLGLYYYRDTTGGRGEAYKWVNLAAAHGHEKAKRLRSVLEMEMGPDAEAKRLANGWLELRTKAWNGDAKAQYDVAEALCKGTSRVAEDEAEGLKWYRKAAEQGYGPAQSALAATTSAKPQ